MNMMKKIPFALAMLASGSLLAAMDIDSRVSKLESEMKQVGTKNQMDTYGANTASARAETNNTNVYLGMGFVYQQPRSSGTEFAYSENNASTATPLEGDLRDIDYKWQWGLSAQLGWHSPVDCMDIETNYKYFDGSQDGKFTAGNQSTLVQTRAYSGLTDSTGGTLTNVTTANSNLSLSIHQLNLGVARSFFVSSNLSFRPSYGLYTAWVDAKQATSYTGGTTLTNNSVYVNDRSKSWGLGPFASLGSNWYAGHGVSLVADAFSTLAYTKYDVSHEEKYSIDATNTVKIRGDNHQLIPVAGLTLGGQYETYLDECRHHVCLSLGYNLEYFFNQNQIIKVTRETAQADGSTGNTTPVYSRTSNNITLHGLVAKGTWSF